MDYSSVTFIGGGIRRVQLDGVRFFDADKIFDCGQAFRFSPVDGTRHEKEWSGVARGIFVSVGQDGCRVVIYNSDERDFREIWEKYFSLDLDYGEIEKDILSRHPSERLREAALAGRGIRILRQDPWEALCSFIISQNNNIPRIRSLVSALSRAAGERVDTRGMEDHGAAEEEYAFPSAGAVASLGEDALKEMRMGFRAGYIDAASKSVAGGSLRFGDVEKLPTADASRLLQTLRGVGPKVAACVLLFGFFRTDAFPVDVWIRRVLEKYFPEGLDPSELGQYAGIAQQFLFRYERETQGV
ncbi:MAG: DNA-3-methyladenine glycosylase 2 family protein [Clostridia bacterium]|nr:DNA-3-methyladenine glycosylase 2 family protein [Clostridia bacterium]